MRPIHGRMVIAAVAVATGCGLAATASAHTAVAFLSPPVTLKISVSQARPGDTVSVTGDGFTQCLVGDPVTSPTPVVPVTRGFVRPPSVAPAAGSRETQAGNPVSPGFVLLRWDGAQAVDTPELTALGHFTTNIAVPANAAPTDHIVTAECFWFLSGILAKTPPLRVLPGVVSTATPSPATPSSSLPPPPTSPATATSPTDTSSSGSSLTGAPSDPTSSPALPLNKKSLTWKLGIWLAIVVALLIIFILTHIRSGRRQRVQWVHEHVHTAGHPAAPTTTVQPRPCWPSLSISLRPHGHGH